MLVVERRTGILYHRHARDLPEFLRSGDLLVANNTRVIPARVFGAKPTGGKVEILFLEERSPGTWEVLLHASRRPKVGDAIRFGPDASAVLLEDGEKGRAVLRVEGAPVPDLLDRLGVPPLPPYIRRPAEAGVDDQRYQTIYAEQPGAVAAPTAGLHFTPELLARLDAEGIPMVFLTLHVGIGTFRPVSAENVEEHRMESERYELPERTADAVGGDPRARGPGRRGGHHHGADARSRGRGARARVVPCSGRTELFIRPPFEFRVTDALLTNFHLPRSTLLMLVCAFAGRELVLRAYREAVEQGYRFYSYGDCMLLL